MSDYPSDEEVREWMRDEAIIDDAYAVRRLAMRAIAWARANPAPQEPPIGADPAMPVGIDDEDDDGWYSYDPGNTGYEPHASAYEARETIREALEEYRNEALGDEWSLDAGFLHWGRIVPHGWTEEVTEGEHTDYVMREAAPQEPDELPIDALTEAREYARALLWGCVPEEKRGDLVDAWGQLPAWLDPDAPTPPWPPDRGHPTSADKPPAGRDPFRDKFAVSKYDDDRRNPSPTPEGP